MPDREEFIETQARFQFGRCEAPSRFDLREIAEREAKARPSLAFHDVEDGSFVPAERGVGLVRNGQKWQSNLGRSDAPVAKKLKASRKADVLSDLYELGLRAPVILDMNDAVGAANAFPVFQYNRLSGAPNAILWLLRRVHGIGSDHFVSLPDPSEPPLREKKPRVFWRGSLRGYSAHAKKHRSITGLVKHHVTGRMSREDLLAHLATVPRYIFVSRYFSTADFDIGFSRQHDKAYMGEVPDIRRFEKERVLPSEQLDCKYLLAISGTDVSSSFGWQLSTNSVILRESYPWEVFFDCHFRPWEHYVPIRSDFTDVLQQIDWCERHPEECDAMIERRHKLIPLLLDGEARREALRRVVERYNDFYFQGDYQPRPGRN